MDDPVWAYLSTFFKKGGLFDEARVELIEAESLEGGRFKTAAFEIRDTFVHVVELIQTGQDPDLFEKHKGEIETHLTRVRNECAEFRAESAILRLERDLA